MRRKYWLLIIWSLSQLGLCVYVAYLFGTFYRFLAVAVSYFLVTSLLLIYSEDARDRRISVLIITLPPALIYLPIHVFTFMPSRISMPASLANFWGIGMALLVYYARKTILKGAYVITFAAVTIYVFNTGYQGWLNYLNFGTYTGTVSEPVDNFTLYRAKDAWLPADSLKNKLVVLDFWDTACGICIRKFPVFDQKRKYYSKYKNVKFYSVNIPLKTDTLNQAFATIKGRGFNFPNLFMFGGVEMEKFKVKAYPTVILLLNGEKVIFRGEIEDVDKYITAYAASTIIDKE